MSIRWAILVIGFLVAVPAVRAHKLEALCTLQGDKIRVEAWYVEPGLTPDKPEMATNAKVRVERDDEILAVGRTDGKGIWEFPRPSSGKLTVFVDAGAGHATTKSYALIEMNGQFDLQETFTLNNVLSPGGEPVLTASDDTPNKDAANRFPYAKVGLGLGTIALVGCMTWWILHERRRKSLQQP